MTKLLISLILFGILLAVVPMCAAALPSLTFPHHGATYCPALDVCTQAGKTRGTKEWFECITLYALRDPPGLSEMTRSENVNPRDVKPPAAVLMDCMGVGWGNRIRAFQVPVSLSLISGISLAYTDFYGGNGAGNVSLARLFAPPAGSSSWNHGVYSFSKYQVPWTYAQSGFSNGPNGMWRDELLVENMATWDAEHPVLFSMTCGSVSDFYTSSNCIKELLPPISTCQIYHMLPNIPFFGAAFSRGTPLLSSLISSIRQRAGVVVPPSEERWPGSNGLRTSGNFVLAFHYRRPSEKTENGQSIPIAQDWIGAENDDNHHTWRSVLAAATEAKAEADSKKKQLLIYFATDYEDFRPIITRVLANIATPVFGLRPEDVGHIVYGSEMQADYSFAEWWILAQAEWLIMLYPSAYSTTAAEVGFGTTGAMQRFDYVGQKWLRSQYPPECFGGAPRMTSEL